MAKIKSAADALLLLSEGLHHAAKNPNILKYKPHEKQYEFHTSKAKKKLYIGGNRSGKSVGGVCEDIWRATCKHPYRPDLNAIGPNRGRVVGVDFVQGIEKILFPLFQQWLYPSALRGGAWETAYDKQLRMLNFDNGSNIEFMSYDQDLDKFAGTSRHWIHFDEEPPQPIWTECRARLIDTNGDYYITMTPVEGMTWVYDDLYEGHVDNPDSDVHVIEINTYQNPYLSREAIDSFASGDDSDNVRLGGKFNPAGGLIYKEFDPKEGGAHVIEPIDDPKKEFKEWLWINSLDSGLNNPSAIYWTAVGPQGQCITFEEIYVKEKVTAEIAELIHETERRLGRQADLRVADPSIQNRNPVSGTSVHEEFVKKGLAFTFGNNDVKAGLTRFRGYLKPTYRKTPTSEPIAKWRITSNCTWAIWELKKYRYKVYAQKKLRYENNPYEEPQKKDDHACDSLRYMIMTRPDLRADESFKDELNNIANNLGAVIVRPAVADPHELLENPRFDQEYNSIPNRLSDWEFDEHMGGVM